MKRYAFTAALFSGALLGAAALSTPAMAQDQERFVTIGTGGQTGVYYVVGQSICRLVNRNSEDTNIRCNAPSTGGSVANINGIKSDELSMGVAQSDVQYRAYNGEGDFKEPMEDLRAVFSVHGEPLTVLARKDADINGVADLKGKRVNIGNPGSGQRATMEVLMDAEGWDTDVFSLASELGASEMASALSDNNIDAMAYVVGHPNGAIQEATTTVDANLVPLNDDAVDGLVDEYPYYAKSVIPGGMYKGNDDDVETFGVKATFVTSSKVDDDVVYEVVKAVFDNFDRFKRLHPAFANLKPEEMISDGLSAPLHEGAKRYYEERGWL